MVVSIKVTALVDDTTHKGHILAEHGLSLFIEVKNKSYTARILFDAGSTGSTLVQNSKELGVDLSTIDYIVISHNHYDHTGGLLHALEEIGRPLPIIMHPDALRPNYAISPTGVKKLRYVGPPFTWDRVKEKGGILTLSKEPVVIAENVMTTGEIPRSTEFEDVDGFYTIDSGKFKKDNLPDDQALAIKFNDDSLALIAGCGHSGIINTIQYAMELTNANRVRAIIGGFHLMDAKRDRVERTVQELKKLNPEVIAPMHCTGFKAMKEIADALPTAFKELYCGDYIEVR